MVDVLAGIYRHYKGPLYLVLGLAHDANADSLADYRDTMQRVYAHNRGDEGVPNKPTPLGERTVVLYIGLELDGAHTGPRLAVRTYDDFFALVHRDGTRCEGEVCSRQYDGSGSQCTLQRFTYVGPTYEPSEVGI